MAKADGDTEPYPEDLNVLEIDVDGRKEKYNVLYEKLLDEVFSVSSFIEDQTFIERMSQRTGSWIFYHGEVRMYFKRQLNK